MNCKILLNRTENDLEKQGDYIVNSFKAPD